MSVVIFIVGRFLDEGAFLGDSGEKANGQCTNCTNSEVECTHVELTKVCVESPSLDFLATDPGNLTEFGVCQRVRETILDVGTKLIKITDT